MQILVDNALSVAADQAPTASQAKVSSSVPTSPSDTAPVTPAATNGQTIGKTDVNQEPLLTFRQDSTGRVYYVITDAQSGKEIAQLPPEQIRDVAEGIAAFLKQQESKGAANPHIVTEG